MSLAEIRERLDARDRMPDLDAVTDQFLSAVVDGDLAGARRTIHSAAGAGVPTIDIFDDILRPALYEVGRQWETGHMLVPWEKEMSELTRDLIAELARPSGKTQGHKHGRRLRRRRAAPTGPAHDLRRPRRDWLYHP